VAGRAGVVGRSFDLDRWWCGDERAWRVVDHAAGNVDAALVAEFERDFKIVAERRRAGPRALDDQTFGARQRRQVDGPGEESKRVPGGHDEKKTCVPECRDGPQQAEQRNKKEAPSKAEAEAFGALRGSADRRGRKHRLHYLGTSTEPTTSVSTRSLSR